MRLSFEKSGEGTVCKHTSQYHSKGDAKLNDDIIQAAMDKAFDAKSFSNPSVSPPPLLLFDFLPRFWF